MDNQSDIVLVTDNYGGNLHATADAINRQGYAPFVFAMSSVSTYATIVIFRVTKKQAKELFGRDL